MGRIKFYRSRDGGYRRYNSYSVGYSEALEHGLVPDTVSNRKRFGNDFFDKREPVEWHHGLGDSRVYFYEPLFES